MADLATIDWRKRVASESMTIVRLCAEALEEDGRKGCLFAHHRLPRVAMLIDRCLAGAEPARRRVTERQARVPSGAIARSLRDEHDLLYDMFADCAMGRDPEGAELTRKLALIATNVEFILQTALFRPEWIAELRRAYPEPFAAPSGETPDYSHPRHG